jgi:AcrR family transcriptional regulator
MSTRAKPIQERSQQSRQVIFESALALFRENGYERTTMRDIATKAKVAVGAAYYYFRKKEDLVHEYYLMLEEGSAAEVAKLCASTTSFKARVRGIITFKLHQVTPDRSLTKVLARIAADPDNELSPFSRQTQPIRDQAIRMMEQLVEGSDLKCGAELRPHVARLIWLLFMGMIFFWIQDRSPSQKQTEKLSDIAVSLTDKVLWLSSLPLTGPINRLTIDLTNTIFDAFTHHTTELPSELTDTKK